MKKIIITFVALCLSVLSVEAQPSAVKNAAKAVFTLTTFKKDGTILASSHGVFVGNKGEALSTWTPFVGAERAVVVDANGKTMNVKSINGANELYDVCKFVVDGSTSGASIATSPSAKGGKAWYVGYSVKKNLMKEMNISNVEKFMDKYSYYILSTSSPENAEGCPLVNQSGQVVAILQNSKSGNETHATDAQFVNSFKTSGLSINDPVLTQTNIRVSLPDNEKEALLTMMLSSERRDSIKNVQYIDEFIQKFPNLIDGYSSRAQLKVNSDDFAGAESDMQAALSKVTKKDEAHSSYSKVIYLKEIYKADKPFSAWSLDKALEEAKKAYEINPLPQYSHQQAQILYAQKDYQNAYNTFMQLTKTPLKNGEIFYEAAQCKTQLGAPQSEIMALLDSAIAACPQPLTPVAAPYVLARGAKYQELGEYRKAVTDYNQYDSLMYGRPISSEFYYAREQCEVQIRQYKQALDDLTRAIILTPTEPTYWAELSSLQLRVNQFDNAIKSAKRCIEIAPEYADAYIVLGIAQIKNNDKKSGLESLQKAKELGDARADELIKKYK